MTPRIVTADADVHADGTLTFTIATPPRTNRIEINGCSWDVPPGATHARITLSTNDHGHTTPRIRPVYQDTP